MQWWFWQTDPREALPKIANVYPKSIDTLHKTYFKYNDLIRKLRESIIFFFFGSMLSLSQLATSILLLNFFSFFNILIYFQGSCTILPGFPSDLYFFRASRYNMLQIAVWDSSLWYENYYLAFKIQGDFSQPTQTSSATSTFGKHSNLFLRDFYIWFTTAYLFIFCFQDLFSKFPNLLLLLVPGGWPWEHLFSNVKNNHWLSSLLALKFD